jgi:hypothetical protein
MLRKTTTLSALAAVITGAVLVPAAIAASMEREIISIAKNGRDLSHNRRISHSHRHKVVNHKSGRWKTTVCDWKNNKRKNMNGYVPPRHSH